MTVQTPFTLPSSSAGLEAFQSAADALNAVRLTEDHVRHGFGFLVTAHGPERMACMERLVAYMKAEGLYPADIAAEAIAIRAGWLHAHLSAGFDPEIDCAYTRFASDPITPADLGGRPPRDPEEPEEDEPLDDEIPW